MASPTTVPWPRFAPKWEQRASIATASPAAVRKATISRPNMLFTTGLRIARDSLKKYQDGGKSGSPRAVARRGSSVRVLIDSTRNGRMPSTRRPRRRRLQ